MKSSVATADIASTAVSSLQTKDALLVALHEQQRLIAEQSTALDDQRGKLEEQSGVIGLQKTRITVLEEQLRLAAIKRFAASSEKSSPDQIDLTDLFDEAEQLADGEADIDAGEVEEDEPETPSKPPKKKGRKGLSPDLPRERIELLLSDAEREGATSTFFTKVKEELHIVPAVATVKEYWQEKAVFSIDGERQIVVAQRPPHPLGKCIASTDLLAWVITAKFTDGLPLYRLESILKRYGGSITRTAMANWVIRLADKLQPLLKMLYANQMLANYLQGDETPIQVLKEPGRNATGDKFMWVLRGGPPRKPVIAFHYHPSRAAKVVDELLADYLGDYFQSDAYVGYNGPCARKNITQLGCWDHARRKFKEAEKSEPKKSKKGAPSKASMALSLINKLYRIERSIAEMDVDEKYEQRQKRSLPALEKLKAWLDINATQVYPDGLTGKAIAYALNQWAKLVTYTEHGELNISNCGAENAIRPFVIGRKNWLFADTPKGASASASFYTLVETAKANGVEPHAYLSHIIKHIATADTAEELEALLPWNMP